jgi:predicted secreted protein
MRKKSPIIILSIIILAGILASVSPAENTCQSGKGIKEKVIAYLEDSALEPGFKGEIFADYYKFGRDENNLYIWAYVCEYYKKDGRLRLGSGRSGPMIIALSQEGVIKDHWQPGAGEEYPGSIKDNFPKKFQNDILNFQSQHKDILDKLKDSVRKKAGQEIPKSDIIMRPGEIKTIKLEANRTTGYKWFYKIKDKNIIKAVSDKYKEQAHKQGVVGVDGQRILKIRGLKTGTTTIKFEYYRKWEPEDLDKTKEIKVRVKDQEQARYRIPDNLDGEYISVRDWEVEVFATHDEYPPEFKLAEDRISYRKTAVEGSLPVRILKKTINGQEYCIKVSSQGAAGSIYKKYTYATARKGKLISVSFTARYTQCGNYGQPKRSECRKERQEYDLDQVVDNFVKNTKFK